MRINEEYLKKKHTHTNPTNELSKDISKRLIFRSYVIFISRGNIMLDGIEASMSCAFFLLLLSCHFLASMTDKRVLMTREKKNFECYLFVTVLVCLCIYLYMFQHDLLKSHRPSMSSMPDTEQEAAKRTATKNIKGLWRDAFRALKTSTTSGTPDEENRSVSVMNMHMEYIFIFTI